MKKEKLVNICTPKQWKTIPMSELKDIGYPVYGANGIIGYYDKYNHENETVTITCRGATCGSVNITEPKAYITGNAMCLDFVVDGIELKYLYYLMCAYDFSNVISGSAQPQITREGLSQIMVNIADLQEQKKIVNILDKVSSLILDRQTQIKKIDELVKSRFVEMFGDPVNNEKHWNTMPLENACISIVDCPHSTPHYTSEYTGYMCIRTSVVKKNQILWDKIEYIPENEYIQRIKQRKPQKGDVIYTREGAILGIAAVIDRDYNIALGQRTMLLSPDTSICLPEFLSMAMNFDSFLNKVLEGVSGSASPHINVGNIRIYNIMMPPIELQNTFAVFVQQTDKSKYYSKIMPKTVA